jgi:hypothetical protein
MASAAYPMAQAGFCYVLKRTLHMHLYVLGGSGKLWTRSKTASGLNFECTTTHSMMAGDVGATILDRMVWGCESDATRCGCFNQVISLVNKSFILWCFQADLEFSKLEF